MRIVTELELDQIKEALENSFVVSKEVDDIDLMIDLARCMELVNCLKRKTAEELVV